MIRYKLYYANGNGNTNSEYFTKNDILKFKREEFDTLFEMAEHMMFKFNQSLARHEHMDKRYCYKLEEVRVKVLGSEQYYGLKIGEDDIKPEFK